MSKPDHTNSSTITRLLRSSPDDELLHRALALPRRFPGPITFTDINGQDIPSHYVFDSSEPVGEGGTAVVFRVRDTRLDVVRALKILMLDLSQNEESGRRWQREREFLLALERVDVPSVPTIFDIATINGLPAIVMQFIQGQTLSRWMSTASVNGDNSSSNDSGGSYLQAVIGIVESIAESLSHIEKHMCDSQFAGFAHGDLKPSNIVVESTAEANGKSLISPSRVWILDFGEASVQGNVEARGITPRYSSPEQMEDWAERKYPRANPSTDQYQLGVILQDLLLPLEGEGGLLRWTPKATALAWRVRHLLKVARVMTARRPVDRFPGFAEVALQLARTRNLPVRRSGLIGAVCLLCVFVFFFVASSGLTRTTEVDARDSRPLSAALVTTNVENEWQRWHNSTLHRATNNRLEEELDARVEEWRAANGKATADAIAGEMRRRLEMLSRATYRLHIAGATVDEKEMRRRGDKAPQRVVLSIKVDRVEVLACSGRIVSGSMVELDQQSAAFEWRQGQELSMDIDYESSRDIAESQRHADNKRRHDEQMREWEEGDPTTRGPKPVYLDPLPKFRIGIDWGVGPLSLTSNTKCKNVDGDSFFGRVEEKPITWDLRVECLR